jgi:hypothetical protein
VQYEVEIYRIDTEPAGPPRVERSQTLSERAVDLMEGLNRGSFTVQGFVRSAKRDGVADHRDISVMLRHLVNTDRIRPHVAAQGGLAARWRRCADRGLH